MLYTRRNKKKPRLNWGRILLTLTAVAVVGLSSYFLAVGLSQPGSGQPASAAPSAQATPVPQTESPQSTPIVETEKATPTPVPATPVPSPTPEAPKLTGTRSMRVGAVGDLSSGEFLLKAAKSGSGYDYAEMFARVKPYLSVQDYTLAQMDSTLSAGGAVGDGSSPAQLLDSLKAAGFDVLGLACEHSLDNGVEGAMEAAALVKEKELLAVGAYESGADYFEPLILEKDGMRVAVLNYTTHTEQTPDGAKDVVKYLDALTLQNDMDAIRAQAVPVDFVIAMVHWGEENAEEVAPDQKQWAQEMADAGVDVILGSHPHILQPIEEITAQDGTKTLVAYSLGNFLSQQRSEGRDAGAILSFTLFKDYDTGETRYQDVSYQPSWVLRYSIQGKYHFEIMPVNEFAEKSYQNMNKEAKERIAQVAEEVRSRLGETIGKLDSSVAEQTE